MVVVVISMDVYQGVALLAGLWTLVYLLDLVLKLYAGETARRLYDQLFTQNGFSVGLGRCQIYTRSFNSLFMWLGKLSPSLLDKWFDAGVVASLICGVLSVIFLCSVPINTLLRSQAKEDQILKPVIPGVNLPKKDFSYYIITLFISAVLHEFGHAIAAVREGVRINGFGLFMFIMYPGAYVDMHSETLFSVSSWRQLRIFCGGIWHNIIIVMMGVAIIFSLPTLLSPAYTVHEQLVIVSHTETSVVQGKTGFEAGDVIIEIDGAAVTSVSDWMNSLVSSLQSNTTVSYKIPGEVIQSSSHPTSLSADDCTCSDISHICFQHSKIAEVPTDDTEVWCMNARDVISYSRCPSDEAGGCITPYIKHISNMTRLLVIYRSHKPPVLFYGHPADLHKSLILGEVVPKMSSAPLHLPYILENLAKYFISLSGALAILNIVPCYALDGQYIAKALVDIIFYRHTEDRRELILTLVILCGTALLLGNVILAIYSLF